jgi:thiamine pyrophosphate-dependent acetolactate synthase large subunit-like protein
LTISASNRSAEREGAIYGSDIIVNILSEYGLEYVAANIGSTFRGLWDSLVNYGHNESPKCVSVAHEEIAIAIAHGYAKASGRPMVALVHDTVGLQHASMAIYNAWCDRVPLIVLGASGPTDASKRRPWIDWIHSSMTPNELVRSYVKWDDFPASIPSALESFVRAYNLAVTDPTAPVFVCFDSEYLEDKVNSNTKVPLKSKNPPPKFPDMDPSSLEEVAKIMLDSESPFIVAGTVGRNLPSVGSLVELAETTGAFVFDTLDRFNFPNTHPLDAPNKEFLSRADSILALDTQKIASVLLETDKRTRQSKRGVGSETKVMKIGLEDILTKSWAADYQGLVLTEISILADTSMVLSKLSEICKKIIRNDPSKKKAIDERLAQAIIRHNELRERSKEEAKSHWNRVPISPARLAAEVWELVRNKPWIIANGTLGGWVRRLWDWKEPGCYLGGSGGAGLGYGLPASIGVALASMKNEKKPLVVDFQPDGDFLYTSSALWTAAHYRIPLLVIMFNNRSYYNDAEHNKVIAKARGRDEQAAFHIGGDISDPNVDFAGLARSQGVYGEGPIEKPDQLSSVLTKAMRVVEMDRMPALVDVVTGVR